MTTRRAGIILINNDDNILLVKGRTKKWGFPITTSVRNVFSHLSENN